MLNELLESIIIGKGDVIIVKVMILMVLWSRCNWSLNDRFLCDFALVVDRDLILSCAFYRFVIDHFMLILAFWLFVKTL